MRLTHEEVPPASEHCVAKRYTIAVTRDEATLVGCSETGPSVTFSVGCRKGEPC